MRLYDDEDNALMNYDIPIEYTAIINERLFRETGILEITPSRAEPGTYTEGIGCSLTYTTI